MSKRIFQILDDMNLSDIESNTRLVAISNTLISADKVKQGGKIAMGVDNQALFDIIDNKAIPILIVMDAEEYWKRKNASVNF